MTEYERNTILEKIIRMDRELEGIKLKLKDVPLDEADPLAGMEAIEIPGSEEDVAKQRWSIELTGTPGPAWIYDRTHGKYLVRGVNEATDEQIRVMAAATDMLEVHEEIMAWWATPQNSFGWNLASKIQDVIKKARGGE